MIVAIDVAESRCPVEAAHPGSGSSPNGGSPWPAVGPGSCSRGRWRVGRAAGAAWSTSFLQASDATAGAPRPGPRTSAIVLAGPRTERSSLRRADFSQRHQLAVLRRQVKRPLYQGQRSQDRPRSLHARPTQTGRGLGAGEDRGESGSWRGIFADRAALGPGSGLFTPRALGGRTG